MPVVGRTEDSQKVIDKHFEEWQASQKDRQE